MEQKLKADRREDTGKGAARKARAAGRVPGVVYGHGADPLHISVDARDLFHTLHTEAGVNVLVDLRVDGDHFLAMPREVQRDHLRGRLLHVDFLRIARDEKITVEVPIQLVGESHGVKEGGVIEHHLWTLQVECFPQDVPTSIDADVSALGLNESLKVEDLQLPDKLELQTPLEEVVVSVVPPQVLKLEEEEEALEEAAEGEGEPTQDLASGESAAEGEG
ncbi:MAG: 50S ribosomal protein L25/general stress protein Ctc [Actinobacteria bacterium]|nr:50S ribosomal protein L25/general stress protein Ctc [Actinomycetota bacterium]